jgi:hypothetical protein
MLRELPITLSLALSGKICGLSGKAFKRLYILSGRINYRPDEYFRYRNRMRSTARSCWTVWICMRSRTQVHRDALAFAEQLGILGSRAPISSLFIVEHWLQSQFSGTMARVSARKPEAGYRGE